MDTLLCVADTEETYEVYRDLTLWSASWPGRLSNGSDLLRGGAGLEVYRRKRHELLRSPVHLIEIDLLRAGERPGLELHAPPLECEYVALVNRVGERRVSDVWPIALTDRLPVLPVPLSGDDPDVPLDLPAALDTLYEAASYGRRLDYTAPVPPPELGDQLDTWAREICGGASEAARREG